MDLRSDLAATINFLSGKEGFNETPLKGTQCIKYSQTDRRTNRRWRASLCIVAQGCTEIVLGRHVYRYEDQAHYIVTPIDLPVTSRIFSASFERPFLCLRIDFDPLVLNEIAAQIEQNSPLELESPLRAVFIGKASDLMLEAALRLGKLFQTPEAAPVLGPWVIRELLYHLLKGPDGPAIRQFVRSGSKMHRISEAIYNLRSEYNDDVDVETLAKSTNMSRAAFFKHFKEITSMSPIQYQKRLRLLEARRLMTDEGETAEGSAFKVGYKSASQFSREYSRMFGNSPIRDSVKLTKRFERTGVKLEDF